jgi:hypothetical protein
MNQLSIPKSEVVPRPKMTDIKHASGIYPYGNYTLAICHGAMYFTGTMNGFSMEHWMHVMMGKRYTNIISADSVIYGLHKDGKLHKCDLKKEEETDMKELRNKKLIQLVAGEKHITVLDEKGVVRSWPANQESKITALGMPRSTHISAGGQAFVALTCILPTPRDVSSS